MRFAESARITLSTGFSSDKHRQDREGAVHLPPSHIALQHTTELPPKPREGPGRTERSGPDGPSRPSALGGRGGACAGRAGKSIGCFTPPAA